MTGQCSVLGEEMDDEIVDKLKDSSHKPDFVLVTNILTKYLIKGIWLRFATFGTLLLNM